MPDRNERDELHNLEDRLRRSKPETEPLPPAFKQRLWTTLMEDTTVSPKNRFSSGFKQLGYQLLILVVLVALSLVVWLSLRSASETPATSPTPTGPIVSLPVKTQPDTPPAVTDPDLTPTRDEPPARLEPGSGRLFFIGGSTEEDRALYRVAPDGTALAAIPTVAFNGQPPVVSPDGARLAYVSACRGEMLMQANPDGSQPMVVLDQPDVTAIRALTWAPATTPETGRGLAFVALRSDEPSLYLIGVAPDTTTFYPLPSALASYGEPDWSPDGQRVVFTAGSGETGGSSLYVVAVSSRDVTRLTEEGLDVSGPRWSPDGQRIAFIGESSGQGSDIYTIRPGGSELTRLTTSQQSKRELAWSPDSALLACSAETAGNGVDIYVLTADGTQRAHLATAGDDLAPVWSPDGRQLAFVSEGADGGRYLYLAPAAGGEPVRVTEQLLQAARVAWVPDPEPALDQVTIRGVVADVSMAELPTTITLEQSAAGYDRILFKEEDAPGINQETGQEEPGRTVQTRVVARNGFAVGPMIQPGSTIEVTGQPGENGTLIADVIWLLDFEVPCQGASSSFPVWPAAGERRVPGIIDYFDEPSESVISAPEVVEPDTPFGVEITTFGGGCEQAGGADVVVTGNTADITVYDYTTRGSETPCPDELRRLSRTVTLQFPEPGEATIKVHGVRVGPETDSMAGAPTVLEQSILIR